MEGFLLIDKEKGWTSFDVVKKIRNLIKEKKVGHAGTLDPLATGLLLVAVGKATKKLQFFVGCDKEYEVLGYFGYISDTYDADGKIEKKSDKKWKKKEVEKIIKEKFLGEFLQMPPIYSAIKLKGKKAYELARKGKEVKLDFRKVRVDLFEITDFNWPKVSFKISCGSGTYVRSLINDLGEKLGSGGYVEDLRRTKIGDFCVEEAVRVGKVKDEVRVLEIEEKKT